MGGLIMLYRCNGRGSRRATAATELALLLPVLVVPLVASIDLAKLFYADVTINSCARNGALYASNPAAQAQSPYANVTAAATADASTLSPAPTVDAPTYCATLNGTYSSTPLTSGYVKVTVKWNVTTLFTYPGIPTQLSRSVTMRIIPA
jgi:Flp pilus assembly protein TadG